MVELGTSMLVDVYHAGTGTRVQPPFLLVAAGAATFPAHQLGGHHAWIFWKQVPIHTIAAAPKLASAYVRAEGFYIQ